MSRIYTHPHEFPEFKFSWLSRSRRSQRREVLALLGMVEVLRMDLASWRVGTSIPGTPYLQGLSIKELAAWTGVSVPRVARGIQDFTRAGYQVGHLDKRGRLCAPQPKETRIDQETGERTYRSQAAVRKFTPLMFRRLGNGLDMAASSKRASSRRSEQAEKNRAALLEVSNRERARLYKLREARRAEAPSAPPPHPGRVPEELKEEIAAAHPDWDLGAILHEAHRRLGWDTS
jgi:hypothetical protein